VTRTAILLPDRVLSDPQTVTLGWGFMLRHVVQWYARHEAAPAPDSKRRLEVYLVTGGKYLFFGDEADAVENHLRFFAGGQKWSPVDAGA
jgi:hypothetical protein